MTRDERLAKTRALLQIDGKVFTGGMIHQNVLADALLAVENETARKCAAAICPYCQRQKPYNPDIESHDLSSGSVVVTSRCEAAYIKRLFPDAFREERDG